MYTTHNTVKFDDTFYAELSKTRQLEMQWNHSIVVKNTYLGLPVYFNGMRESEGLVKFCDVSTATSAIVCMWKA